MKPICWDDNDNNMCFWQQSWNKLYRKACDFARYHGMLGEFLTILELEEEEE